MLQRFVGVTLFFLQVKDGDFGTFPGKEQATDRPIPESPPVMRATFPCSF